MDRCTARTRVRVKDARVDDVKATKIKEKRKRKYISVVYVDFHKPKSNADLCTNPVGVLVLNLAMLAPITIFVCFLLHNKIKHQKMLLLGP